MPFVIEPQDKISQPAARIDALAKVTGRAKYAADYSFAGTTHAVLVTSAIAHGSIEAIDAAEARAVEGVLEIYTYLNCAGKVQKPELFTGNGFASTTILPLDSNKIWHDGQIVAMAVAETYEAAREAAFRVKISYRASPASVSLDAAGTETRALSGITSGYVDPATGDAAAALAAAEVRIYADYETAAQHHNPIELFATLCVWDGPDLTIYEPSQTVGGLQHGIAQQLGIDPANVRVICPYVGGAFGCKAAITPRTALVALAARALGRPVKLVATRDQGFTISTYRAETRHHVELGASRGGKLGALWHEACELTSRADDYYVAGTETTARIYDAANIHTKVSVVRADRNTPGFMRSPFEVPYMFALESAMDELAVALGMDPVELRRVNDTKRDPVTGREFSSRSLMGCFDAASKAFDWTKRDPRPGSMREGDWLIGLGCAAACHPAWLGPATARVVLTGDGQAKVETAAHDVGTGAYTVIAQTVARNLGLELPLVTVYLGDSRLPPGPVAGGSITTASVCNAVAIASGKVRGRLAAGAGGSASNDDFLLRDGRLLWTRGKTEMLSEVFARLGLSEIEEYAEFIPRGAAPDDVRKLYGGRTPFYGATLDKEKIMVSFGAEFVEVRVHVRTKEIRVPRITGAFAAGHIVNPLTARSQLMGGMIWGISSALHEATEIDARAGRYINDNLADYLLPVNADIRSVEVIFVPETDNVINPLGIKGIGELANVGTSAAIANAVFHATGNRIRKLPVRIENLLA
ncbi:MAG: xanthine dehydrogenase family protein molybdopterin-binding subunit [Beijerinckiaceae bacterium]|nr:xanthine dehydrogenase family protein molybdopterin-binding subunit [Beijerinckiaceae bacterium]MCI0736484.1 xanthine dehydrogenase family protein molybdopterin-binding subunit [Beijerinckiaceae bacterium]